MPNGKDPVTVQMCQQMRGSCRENVQAQVEVQMSRLTGPIERLETLVKTMDEKLEDLNELFERVRMLEEFKAQHEGAEKERDAHDDVINLRKNIEIAVAASQGKIIADLKTRSSDGGILIPKWAVFASSAILALIVVLAAFAGERVAPFVVDIFK